MVCRILRAWQRNFPDDELGGSEMAKQGVQVDRGGEAATLEEMHCPLIVR